MAPSVEVFSMSSQQHHPRFDDEPFMVGEIGPPEIHHRQQDSSDGSRSSPVVNNSSSETPNTDEEITRPGEHDVLLGRGGGTNNHSGNIKFRQLVNEHKMRYLACSKVDKPKVSREVVQLWRKLSPPGRFLARQDDSKRGPGSVKAADNIWYEVGDKKAREKASQCLRERTPDVMPYIKQLREQQDAITEQGVTMVQHHMQMHQHQPHHQQQHHHHLSPHQHHQQRLSTQGFQDAYTARSPMAAQPFPGRRASMPGPPEPALMGQQQQQQQPQQPGMPTTNNNGNNVFHEQQQRRSSGSGQFSAFDASAASANGLTEMEYQQNMMMMQQQVQMQQLQMRQMQQQRMQQQQQQQQSMHPGAFQPPFGSNNNDSSHHSTGPVDPFPVQSDPLMDLPATDSFLKESSSTTKESTKLTSPASPSQKRSRDTSDHQRAAPDRAISLMSLTPADPTDAGGEITIEEYRKQLEEYIENIENQQSSSANFDNDNDEYASDLEDDWEKEREKNLQQQEQQQQQSSSSKRGVNRNTSGFSFMSAKTTKSGLSMFSGISASMFSEASREQKMNAGRSVCSQLSLMSELTDLSENIDRLALDD